MKHFDLTSDLHIDFWLDYRNPPKKQERLLGEFVAKMLPEEPSNVLAIAGDLGHFNQQNKMMLEAFRKHYSAIVVVFGNHDLYLVSKSQVKKYETSFNRLNEMIDIANSIPNVHFLTGTSVTLDDITFGGSGGWYDNTYAKTFYSMNDRQIDEMWLNFMNDGRLIKDFNRYDLALSEYGNLKSVADSVDVMVSHIAPTYDFIPLKYNNATSTFYQFDGSDLLNRMGSGKVWCYGHTHDKIMSVRRSDTQLCCNPLGYPFGRDYDFSEISDKRKNCRINIENVPTYEAIFENLS